MAGVIALMMMRGGKEKDALSVVRVRTKIGDFEKKAQSLRNAIWYRTTDDTRSALCATLGLTVGESSKPYQLANLSREAIEARFFRLEQPILREDDDPILKLLAHALDAVIATCDLTRRKLIEPEQHVDDGFVIAAAAVLLRRVCKKFDLPHGVRKDVDKMHREGSRFVLFYCKLLDLLGLHVKSTHSLATSIHRLERRLKSRVQSRAKKIS